MLVRLRLDVPDRPGSLGLVASALGAAGADIVRVDVLDSEGGRALDDVFVQVRDAAHLDQTVARLGGVRGVLVTGIQHPAPPTTGHAELELVARLVAAPEVALQTLVDGVPHAVGADWAVLLRFTGFGTAETVLLASIGADELEPAELRMPLRLAALTLRAPSGARTPYGGACLVPVGDIGAGLVVVRHKGPAFHRAELWRLGQIGAVAGALTGRLDAVPAGS